MIPEDSRKLKRGLKDISPLFETEVPEPLTMEPGFEKTGLRLIGLFSPDRNANPSALNECLVSQLLAQNNSASILSLTPKGGSVGVDLKKPWHHFLRWEKFQEIFESSERAPYTLPEMSHTLFLDFDYSNPEQFQKVVSVLDQWILVVRPEMESLSESYRMMKVSKALNSRLEYFLLFDRVTADDQASRLFEKYSELVSRRLGIHLSWLGAIQLENGKGPSSRLALESLFMSPATEMDSVEKRAIAEFLLQPSDPRQVP